MRILPSLSASRDGFLLVEGMLGIALFVIFITAVAMTFIVAQDTAMTAGNASRATFLTEQALEVTGSIRDESFALLTEGTHGFAQSGGHWAFTGTGAVATGGFLTSVTINTVATNIVRATAVTTWQHLHGGSGSLTLTQDFADWKTTVGQAGNCASLTLNGSYLDAGTPLFNRAVRQGDTLFVTSETSAGGAGLYAFDISTETAPVRLASAFSLGFAGHDLGLMGSVLFVLTDDPTAEIRAYDVSSPASLDETHLLGSYDLPGSALGRSLLVHTISGSSTPILVVGAADDAAEPQLLALSVTTTANASGQVTAISFDEMGRFNDPGGAVTGLSAVTPTLLYASNSMNTSELRAYALSVTGASATFTIASGTGANATDVQDGLAIATAGTGALLGRMDGQAIEELALYPLSLTGAPPNGSGPWVDEIGGAVNGLAMDLPGSCAFAATGNPTKELIMLSPSLLQSGDPNFERALYDATTGDGRGVMYDAASNRVYLLTNSALHILQPA